ncbi:6-phosphogluconolactonase [Plebeiibacterium sediminum]|uniref:6-phosphogluconolactonase n=1 Tax=Plebeiibacterium sediminum TaxID=2992112 RepID=A0AAE3MA91_9BACT|nr:6-phosphogluconolactonase [Plebeiobacterium sediminum]MCW3789605.1 6-phosphogluconolactonase [Plebeiobacterium sediminum]
MNINIFKHKQALALHIGQLLFDKSNNQERLNIALSGGSTPKAIFDELALNYKDKIDWNKIHLYWGDERCVPPSDSESNYKMTYDHLLSKVNFPEENIHRVKGELNVNEACNDYIDEIEKTVNKVNDLPQFDIVILGMGADGHTASIFPYQIELWDSEEICVPAKHPESGQERVSFSGKLINNAKEIYFLVTGIDKAEKVAEIINQKNTYQSYPASLVKTPLWFLDEEAASQL